MKLSTEMFFAVIRFSTFRGMTFEHVKMQLLSAAKFVPHVNQTCREMTRLIFEVKYRAKFKRRTLHEPNRMLTRENKRFFLIYIPLRSCDVRRQSLDLRISTQKAYFLSSALKLLSKETSLDPNNAVVPEQQPFSPWTHKQ